MVKKDWKTIVGACFCFHLRNFLLMNVLCPSQALISSFVSLSRVKSSVSLRKRRPFCSFSPSGELFCDG